MTSLKMIDFKLKRKIVNLGKSSKKIIMVTNVLNKDKCLYWGLKPTTDTVWCKCN